MALSVVDIYQKILPKTNCGDCGHPSCLAFSSMVVSEKLPLNRCPHIEAALMASAQAELDGQHADGKWLKRDLAADGFEAEVKLLFDETIVEHLDVESIMFLSERLRQLLCGEKDIFKR